jgi:hypothetical protein
MPDPLPLVIEDWTNKEHVVFRCEYLLDPASLFVTVGFERDLYNDIVIDVDSITDREGNDLESMLPSTIYAVIVRRLKADFHLIYVAEQWLNDDPDRRPLPREDDGVKAWKERQDEERDL